MAERIKNHKVFKAFTLILYVFVLTIGVLWSSAILVANIYPNKAVSHVLEISASNKANLEAPTNFSNDTLDEIYVNSFRVFFVLSMISAVAGTFVLSHNRNPLEILGLFIGYIIPRRRKFWGVVFDSVNGKPIPLVKVCIVKVDDKESKVITEAVTDMDGRYRILIENIEEDYYIEARSSGYVNYRKSIYSKYKSLIKKEIIEDISLDRINHKVNTIRGFRNYIKPKAYNSLIAYLYILTLISFLWAFYGILAYPGLDTLIFFVVYTFALVWNTWIIFERVHEKPGRIIDITTKQPIGGAFVYFFYKNDEVLQVLCDENGIVKADLKPGEYDVKVSKKNYKMFSSDGLKHIHVNQEGYITKDIFLWKLDPRIATKEALLANPFE